MIGRWALLLVELALLFLGVAFLVQIVQLRLGEERLRRWMGGHPVVAALKGIVVGFVTPFCTFSAIPMLVGLRQAGVPPAGYVAFIVAAPVLDPVLFGALVLIVGLDVALVYVAVAFTAAMTLALVAQAAGMARHLRPLPDAAAASCETSMGDTEWPGIRRAGRDAAAAAVRLLRSLGPLLLIGVGIGAAIEMLVTPDAVAGVTGNNVAFAIPVASALGTPLYFNTELFVPIAASLRTAGVGIGAIVALTIAGAGANLPEFVILSKLARPRAMAVFLVYVFGVAMAGGAIAHGIAA